MIVDGYGVDIRVDSGHLVLRSGVFGSADLQELRISRGHNDCHRLLILSHDGSISLAAIEWCHRLGIPIAMIGSDGGLVTCLIPDAAHDGPIKRMQAVSGLTDHAVDLVRWILRRKVESQVKAIQTEFRDQLPATDRQRIADELQRCLNELSQDNTLDALLSREGVAAQAYWSALSGIKLPWPAWTLKRIPEHWTRVWPRESGGRARVRDARDVFNAISNYAYTLAEIETRIACVANGLDPDFGLLHVDDRLRESCLYDLVEPIRSKVDSTAFEFITRHGLRPYMFHELRNGVVRLDPDLARPLSEYIMPRLRRPALEMAGAYAARLRLIKLPYRLTRVRARLDTHAEVPALGATCEYCKQPLPKKGLKFCNRHCYLRHSVEIRQPIKKAQARLAELRAQGLSPGHGGEAAKKRGAKIAESNRRRVHHALSG